MEKINYSRAPQDQQNQNSNVYKFYIKMRKLPNYLKDFFALF